MQQQLHLKVSKGFDLCCQHRSKTLRNVSARSFLRDDFPVWRLLWTGTAGEVRVVV